MGAEALSHSTVFFAHFRTTFTDVNMIYLLSGPNKQRNKNPKQTNKTLIIGGVD